MSVGWNNVKRGGDTWHELLNISAVPVPGDPDALIARQVRALQELLTDDDTPEGQPASRHGRKQRARCCGCFAGR